MADPSALEAIFFAALERRSDAERRAYLDDACEGDTELRASVERMLRAQAQAGSFLEHAAITADAPRLANPVITGSVSILGFVT